MNDFGGDLGERKGVLERDVSIPEHELLTVLPAIFRREPAAQLWLVGTDGVRFQIVPKGMGFELVSEDGRQKRIMTRDGGRRDWGVPPELQRRIADLKRAD